MGIYSMKFPMVRGISKFITLFSICFLFLQLYSILFRAFCIVYLSMQESQLVAGRWGRVSIYRYGNPHQPHRLFTLMSVLLARRWCQCRGTLSALRGWLERWGGGGVLLFLQHLLHLRRSQVN